MSSLMTRYQSRTAESEGWFVVRAVVGVADSQSNRCAALWGNPTRSQVRRTTTQGWYWSLHQRACQASEVNEANRQAIY